MRLEQLEERCLLANLHLVQAFVSNNAGQAATLVDGEEVFLHVDWTTTGLAASDHYVVRFNVDGIPLDSSAYSGAAGPNQTLGQTLGGWFAGPGAHTATVTLNASNTLSESDTSDNSATFSFSTVAPATLPQKFVQPLGGTHGVDWSIVNYVDVDPRVGQFHDFHGGTYTYDGHTGVDYILYDFARMDAGMPVYAAAAGTVTSVNDGNYDRNTVIAGQTPNRLAIDLGNGWTLEYDHFLTNSITVQVGQKVQQGQILGLAGSSGDSNAPHVHFEVLHSGALVETNFAADQYWVQPAPYEGNTTPAVFLAGTTSYNPGGDQAEQPVEVDAYPANYTGNVYFWFDDTHLDPSGSYSVNWYRPDGTQQASFPLSSANDVANGKWYWYYSMPWSQYTGTWHVALLEGGTTLTQRAFTIGNTALAPAIRVSQGGAIVVDGRTTPLDFTSAGSLSFTVQNEGFAALTLGNLRLPPNFSLSGGFPGSIPAGGNATFTLQMNASAVGSQFGEVRFTTNSAADGLFHFNVGGQAGGAAAGGAPSIALNGPAAVYSPGMLPQPIAPQATLAESDAGLFGNGSLQVELASHAVSGDTLAVRNQGTAAGLIGLGGTTVRFGGTPIGTLVGNTASSLSVSLNANASLAAVQALVEDITFVNPSTTANTQPRYVRFTLVDNAGLASNLAVQKVIVASPPAGTSPGTLAVAAAAGAAPNPVAGTTAVLTVLGADVNGESTVSYHWSATTLPAGAALPTYSANDSNAAKTSTVTFYAAGNYVFQATLSDTAGASVTSSVTVAVDPLVTSVAVTPGQAALYAGARRQFSATVYDQFGAPLSIQPALAWNTTIGTIDANGVLTAPTTAASGSITASVNRVTGNATVAVAGTYPTTTVGLFDPQQSQFHLDNVNAAGTNGATFGYGQPNGGWIPLVGDWNGDGVRGVGLYDPKSSTFYLSDNLNTGYAQYTFGFGVPGGGAIPLVGDWNGTGRSGVGLYDPATSTFLLTTALTTGYAQYTFGFGVAGLPAADRWEPLVGDWNGSGRSGVGLYDPRNSTFLLTTALTTGYAQYTFGFGVAGLPVANRWEPLVGDWNGSGHAGVGLYDPLSSTFLLTAALTTGYAQYTFGYGEANLPAASRWQPLVGDWTGAGHSGVGLYDGQDATFYLTSRLSTGYADITFNFGAANAGWEPFVGTWLAPSVLIPQTVAAPAAASLQSASIPTSDGISGTLVTASSQSLSAPAVDAVLRGVV